MYYLQASFCFQGVLKGHLLALDVRHLIILLGYLAFHILALLLVVEDSARHPQHLGIMLLEQLLIKDTLATPKLLAFGKV